MSPEECIAALDNALAEATTGEDVVIRRVVGQGNSTVNVDVSLRAQVRSYRLRDEQLSGDMRMDDLLVTASPSGFIRAQWPGGRPVTAGGEDVSWLPIKGDEIKVAGRWRRIDVVSAIPTRSPVRIEMRVVG